MLTSWITFKYKQIITNEDDSWHGVIIFNFLKDEICDLMPLAASESV